MKKILTIIALSLSLLSCKKERCEVCTITNTSTKTGTNKDSVTICGTKDDIQAYIDKRTIPLTEYIQDRKHYLRSTSVNCK